MNRRDLLKITGLVVAGTAAGLAVKSDSNFDIRNEIPRILAEPFSQEQKCEDETFCHLVNNLYKNLAIADYEIFLHNNQSKKKTKTLEHWSGQRKTAQNEITAFSLANSLDANVETLLADSHEDELKRRDFFEENGMVLVGTEMAVGGEPLYIGGRIIENELVASDKTGEKYKVITYRGTIPSFFDHVKEDVNLAFQLNDTNVIYINEARIEKRLDKCLKIGYGAWIKTCFDKYKPSPSENECIRMLKSVLKKGKNGKKELLETVKKALIAHEISHMEYSGNDPIEDEALAIRAELERFPNEYINYRLLKMKEKKGDFLAEVYEMVQSKSIIQKD